MSATVHAHTPRRGFAPAHPEGAPARLSTDMARLRTFAVVLADFCGEDLDRLTPERIEALQRIVQFACWLTDPGAFDLLARHIAYAREPYIVDAPPTVREGLLTLYRMGLRQAIDASAGLRPTAHHAVVALQAFDQAEAASRRQDGGW